MQLYLHFISFHVSHFVYLRVHDLLARVTDVIFDVDSKRNDRSGNEGSRVKHFAVRIEGDPIAGEVQMGETASQVPTPVSGTYDSSL